MVSPFKSPSGFDCRAKDMLDALTIVHDLGLWDDLTYEFAENPQAIIAHINDNVDDFVLEWEKKNCNFAIRITDIGEKKIQFIKLLRSYTGWAVAFTKTASESTPFICPWYYDTAHALNNSEFVAQLKADCPNFWMQKVQLSGKQKSGLEHETYRRDRSQSPTSHYQDIISTIPESLFKEINNWGK